MRTAEYCRECSGFKGYTDGEDVIEWIVCGRCLPRLAGRGELAGRQPAAVCLECRSPFEATRQAQKFCSSARRARAWRARRAAAVS